MRSGNMMLFAAALISAAALTATGASAQTYYRGDRFDEPHAYRGQRMHEPYAYRRFHEPYAYRGDQFREREYQYRGDRY